LDKKILGGLDLRKFYPELGEALLVAVTEVHTRQQIDELIAGLR
jgi:glycine dehydrogenase subunit 1